jgi:hypothetical protein
MSADGRAGSGAAVRNQNAICSACLDTTGGHRQLAVERQLERAATCCRMASSRMANRRILSASPPFRQDEVGDSLRASNVEHEISSNRSTSSRSANPSPSAPQFRELVRRETLRPHGGCSRNCSTQGQRRPLSGVFPRRIAVFPTAVISRPPTFSPTVSDLGRQSLWTHRHDHGRRRRGPGGGPITAQLEPRSSAAGC